MSFPKPGLGRSVTGECHRDVTGTTLISIQRVLFPLHHCDIHELEARACSANALGPGEWSLENGCWRMVAGEWSLAHGRWRMELLELVTGAWSLENGRWRMELLELVAGEWSLAHGAPGEWSLENGRWGM
jgi:hypothetical protein